MVIHSLAGTTSSIREAAQLCGNGHRPPGVERRWGSGGLENDSLTIVTADWCGRQKIPTDR